MNFDAFFETLPNPALVITANERLACRLIEALRRSSTALRPGATRPRKSVQIVSLHAYLERCWARCYGAAEDAENNMPEFWDDGDGTDYSESRASRDLDDSECCVRLNANQEHALWESIVARSIDEEDTSYLFQTSGIADLVQQAWELLQHWTIPLSELDGYDAEEVRCFVRWASAFAAECQQHHWMDHIGLFEYVAQAFECNTTNVQRHNSTMADDNKPSDCNNLPCPSHITLIGFLELTPLMERFFDRLTALGCRVMQCNTLMVSPREREEIDGKFHQATIEASPEISHTTRSNTLVSCPREYEVVDEKSLQAMIELSPETSHATQYNTLVSHPREHEVVGEKSHQAMIELSPETSRLQYTCCPNTETELYAMARWARRMVESERDAFILCVVPSLHQMLIPVQRIFDEVFSYPSSEWLMPSNKAKPFNISASCRLIDEPLVHTAFLILRLKIERVSMQEISALLRSPFMGGEGVVRDASSSGESGDKVDFGAEIPRDVDSFEGNLEGIDLFGLKSGHDASGIECGDAIDIGNHIDRFCACAQLDAGLRELGNTQYSLASLIHYLSATSDYRVLKTLNNEFITTFCTQLQQLDTISINGRQSSHVWISVVKSLLNAMGWPGARTLNQREAQVMARMTTLFKEFNAAHLITNTYTYEEMLAQLQRLAAKIPFQPKMAFDVMSTSAPVQVLGLLEAIGQPATRTWVMGMDDMHFPAAAEPNPLLPFELQRRFKLPHADADRELHFSRLALQQVLVDSMQVTLSYAELREGQTQQVSPLIRDLPNIAYVAYNQLPLCENVDGVAYDQLPLCENVEHVSYDQLPLDENMDGVAYDQLPLCDFVRSEMRLSRREIPVAYDFNEHAPAIQPNETVRGGTDIFKQQALCPFRAFARHRLHAKPFNEPEEGFNAMEHGQCVHSMLEFFWMSVYSKRRLMALTEAELHAAVNLSVDRAVNKVVAHRTFPRSAIEVEKAYLQRLAMQWLAEEKARPCDFEVVACEQWRSITAGGLTIKTKIDRIDRIVGVVDVNPVDSIKCDDGINPVDSVKRDDGINSAGGVKRDAAVGGVNDIDLIRDVERIAHSDECDRVTRMNEFNVADTVSDEVPDRNTHYMLIDYKTGLVNIQEWFGDRLSEPQLPLYAIGAKEPIQSMAFAQVRPNAVEFKGIGGVSGDFSKEKVLGKDRVFSAETSWEEQLNVWRRTLEGLADDFYNGVASVDPKVVQQTCRYCELRGLCRVDAKKAAG